VRESYRTVQPKAFIIRAAVLRRAQHAFEDVALHGLVVDTEDAGDATHERGPLLA
jgi:hypothetical protein